MTDPTVVANSECELGEGPLWDPETKRVYWCDITGGRLFQYTPETDDAEQIYDGHVIGGYTIQTGGALLLFMESGQIEALRDGTTTTVNDGIEAESDSRFNDVIADPGGRVYCGTMPTDDRGGRLYRLDTDGTLTELWDGLGIPNGMGFSPDEEVLYFVESEPALVYAFDYDAATGELSNRRVFADTSEQPGVPDGLTVDGQGYVWTARWDGASIIRYAPDGSVDASYELPVPYVTSLCFGGADFEDCYVTTADWDEDAGGERAGALFRISSPHRGKAEYTSAIDV